MKQHNNSVSDSVKQSSVTANEMHDDSKHDGHSCCHEHHLEDEVDTTDLNNIDIPLDFTKTVFYVPEMDCPMEGTLIRDKLAGHSAIDSLYFNYLKREVHIVHQNSLDSIVEQIKSLGMTPINRTAGESDLQPKNWYKRNETLRLIIGGIAAAISEVFHFIFADQVWLSAIFAFISIAFVGLGTYKKGWIALKHRNLNINALMSVAVTGAILLGVFAEAAMVMFLFTLSEMIEAKSLNRAQVSIEKLLSLAPDYATVVTDLEVIELPIEEIVLDSVIRVMPGERIPLDGVIIRGSSSLDESPITGESIPVDKSVDDSVYAGSINQQSEFEYRTTTNSKNSTLAKIVKTIEDAQGNRAPVERFIDRFSVVYTPIVFLVAIAIAVISPFFGIAIKSAIYNALIVLIIACPCALVISTPVAIVSALTALARHGILVKGGVYIEKANQLVNLALDKTGTLTQGKPRLIQSIVFDKHNEAQILQQAFSLAVRSDHPVSRAIVKDYQGEFLPVDNFEAISGQGTKGMIHDKLAFMGNVKLMQNHGVLYDMELDTITELEKLGHTISLFAFDGQVQAVFIVADTLRANSQQAIQELKNIGLSPILLSGDNQNAVSFIAEQTGLERAYGGLLPGDKVESIKTLKESGPTGMIGDGINDAPALAVADIGFAMGAIGSDIAIETANVALMDDDLGKLPYFFKLSKRAMSIIRQNIIFALGVKLIFFIAVLIGYGSMWGAVFADVGTSLLVVINGLRLLKFNGN